MGLGAAGATSLSAGTPFFGLWVWAGLDRADGGGTEFSLSGLATAGPLLSRQASSAGDSGHALAFESTAGSFIGSPCGNTNSISGTLCDAVASTPNCGPGDAGGVFGGPFFEGLPGTIAATLSI